jgi:ATP-dependent DNA ligase
MEYIGEWLYKRSTNGNILRWKSKTKNEIDYSLILIGHGTLDGVLQTQQQIIRKGKQKRNISEQAVFQCKALYKEKKDAGYKSLSDLGIEIIDGMAFFQNLTSGSDLKEPLQKALPKYNTSAAGHIKPMLSQPVTRTLKGKVESYWHKVTYPVALEPKLDGVRCLTKKNEVEEVGMFPDYVTSYSREAMSYDFATDKIRRRLEPMFRQYPELILDGELYKHELPQGKISGAMRSKGGGENTAIFNIMEYHVYDIIDTDLPFKERRKFLEKLIKEFPSSFTLNPLVVVENRQELDEYEEIWVGEKYEGIMAKALDGLYRPNVRSYDSIKIKRFQDAEFEISGWVLGERGVQDLVLTFVHPEGREDFKAVATGTVSEKQQLLNRLPFLIGKVATIKFKDYTEYGTPNHGQVKEIIS